MTKLSALVLAGGVIFGGLMSGCGKNTATKQQQQANLVSVLQSTLQLPIPDNSYSVKTAADVKPTDPTASSNFRSLVGNVIDPVAKGLKEMNMHLGQTVSDGARSNDNLTITDAAVASSLTGTADTAAGTIKWVYALSNANYFTGTQQNTGLGLDLSFPQSNNGTAAFNVHVDTQVVDAQTVVKHVSIVMTGVGNLVFSETFTNASTTPTKWHLDGTVNGISPNADWDPAKGGKFFDVGNTPKCFDTSLVNTGC